MVPTAKHSFVNAQVTEYNSLSWVPPDPPGSGLGTNAQLEPFQWIVIVVIFELAEVELPTAQQSDGDTQLTELS
jgi:hypothetical protein